mgnify:CR=1 FL=1
MYKFKELNYKTKGKYDFINITPKVLKLIKESGVRFGDANIQSLHTTCGLIVNENEDGLLKHDFIGLFERLSEKKLYYKHDDFKARYQNMCDGECKNGHSHCKAILLPVNVTLNIINGNLQLGQWQQIFFVELDRKRDRRVQILIQGE